MMQVDKYLDCLTKKLQNNFTIYNNHAIKDHIIDLYAYCNIDNQKYLGSKKLKIWSYEVNEHCLVDVIHETLKENHLSQFTTWLESLISELVQPHPDHMQSFLTGVIVTTKGLSENTKKQIEQYKYNKSFKWGFQGWCDLRLVVVDLANQQVITNKKAEEVKQVYQPIN